MSLAFAPVGRLRTAARVSARTSAFFAGSSVTWFGEFRDPQTGALQEPGLVQFWFLSPEPITVVDGEEETTADGFMVEAYEAEPGVYAATIAPGIMGEWTVRLLANGARCDERTFTMQASAFGDVSTGDTVLVDDAGNWLLWPNGLLMQGDAA